MHFAFEQAFSKADAEELLARELTPESFEDRKADEPLYDSFPDEEKCRYISDLVRGVALRREELDGYIQQYARDWRITRIDRVAVSVMRVAMYEILYLPQVPDKVAINEAVEIAKKYLDTDVVGFVNGILGSFVRAVHPGEPEQPVEGV